MNAFVPDDDCALVALSLHFGLALKLEDALGSSEADRGSRIAVPGDRTRRSIRDDERPTPRDSRANDFGEARSTCGR